MSVMGLNRWASKDNFPSTATYILMLALLGLAVLAGLMMMWPRPWDMLVERVLLRSAAPVPWPAPPSAASVAGCYTLTYSECVLDYGNNCSKLGPAQVELTMNPTTRFPAGAHTVRLANGNAPLDWHWRMNSAGTLSIFLADGFSGLELELGPTTGGLGGRAHTWTDTATTGQWAKVHAALTACPVRTE